MARLIEAAKAAVNAIRNLDAFDDCVLIRRNLELAISDAERQAGDEKSELKRLRACKIDGMTIDDLNRLRQMLVDATAARSDFEKALNASEDRVAELLRENAELDGWKRSAMETIARWDKCHVAAGSPAKPGEYASEATEREILKLRAYRDDMHTLVEGVDVVCLRGENDRLQQQVAELNAKLDTEKRAAISIASAALSTGCVKSESKGTVEAVNDMSAEISRLRSALREILDANGPCSNIAARANARNVLGDE